jgi:hypothetical protein
VKGTDRFCTEALADGDQRGSQFALAHLFLPYCTPGPAEEEAERQKSKSLTRDVTQGEQLLITWLSSVRENDYLSGIVAMNDLLEQC